jgi:hypothetical protein
MRLVRLLVLFVFALGFSYYGFSEEAERIAKIVDLKGQVQLKSLQGDWVPAEVGTTLTQGHILKTAAKSQAVLKLDGAEETATVEINENSQLMLSELLMDTEKGTQKTLLDLAIGKVLIKAQKLHDEKSKFEVKTPTSIVGVRGTSFSVEVEATE